MTKNKHISFQVYLGDYVVVESIAEGRKVQAEIVNILFPQQVKHLKEENMWLVKCTKSVYNGLFCFVYAFELSKKV